MFNRYCKNASQNGFLNSALPRSNTFPNLLIGKKTFITALVHSLLTTNELTSFHRFIGCSICELLLI